MTEKGGKGVSRVRKKGRGEGRTGRVQAVVSVQTLGRVALEDDLGVDKVEDNVSGHFAEVCDRMFGLAQRGLNCVGEKAYTSRRSSATNGEM
jgi:hypothetical protein